MNYKGKPYSEIIENILDNIEKQGNPRTLSVFKEKYTVGKSGGGFT